MDALSYKANAEAAAERLRSLWDRAAGDRIFATFNVPSPALQVFKQTNTEGLCEYPDIGERIAFWDRVLEERRSIEDDSIPSAYLTELDQGLYGGLLGGDVKFMNNPDSGWISSMVAPILDSWDQFDSVALDMSHPWFRKYEEQLRIFSEGCDSRFGLSHFILINQLNLAFELVGATETYLAMTERPDVLSRAIDLAFDLNTAVQDMFFEKAPMFLDGTCSNILQWIPGRIVSESIDPFHMTSVEHFEEWGRPAVERIFDRYDGGVVHIHGNGRHLVKPASTLKGLKAICLGDDKGFPVAFEILPELQSQAGGIPLMLQVDYRAFASALEGGGLCGGVLYEVMNAPDIETVNRCMESVRDYRA